MFSLDCLVSGLFVLRCVVYVYEGRSWTHGPYSCSSWRSQVSFVPVGKCPWRHCNWNCINRREGSSSQRRWMSPHHNCLPKREDKLKKRRDELAQEKAANARTLPPNTIRWVIRPTGTVVTFSEDVGLPST
ncbi:hypothetical protein IFM89_008151 [Coptis chinensis]|uniref:Uncharacterized protein n=1 Tax=Coptis chinensis TaxID=261450 RepID=A0A835IVX3_9MAGN|nr:hypothetical protein IFM89_008151 [Coptis chinensis]